MDDQDVIGRINEIAHEEHELWEKEGRRDLNGRAGAAPGAGGDARPVLGPPAPTAARRSAGLDPDDATVRDPRTVEGYTG